jgi:agmatine deiminase
MRSLVRVVFGVMVCLACAQTVAAELPRGLPDSVLQQIKDDKPTPPRYAAPWELPLSIPRRLPFAPPPMPARAPAEFEANDGLLLRWGSFNSVITEIAVAATTADSSVQIFLVVANATEQTSATTTLQNAGANIAQVRFITAASNSVWMRDYGPRSILLAGERAHIDHVYNRNRPADDAIPTAVANYFSESKYDLPLVHGGGNFHLFADRDAFMTELVRNENSTLSNAQIIDYFQQYQGLNLTLTPAFPASFDSTQHIDMWMLPVANKRVIISEYPNTGGNYTVPRQVSEDTTANLQARGYTVIRTPGWQALRPGSATALSHMTYANAVVLNKQVLMCRFTGEDTRNAQALASFQQAFPGRTITTIDCSSIIHSAGAIHCIVMHVSTALMLRHGFED